MIAATVTATEMQNRFGKYLSIVMNGGEVIVTKNGRSVGRFIPEETAISYLTDNLTGILSSSGEDEDMRNAALREKYALAD